MNSRPQEKNQSDLFDQVQVDKKIRRKTRFLLPEVKDSITISYETMIFFMIGFVMVCVMTFSLGVEKGRCDEKKKRIIITQQVSRGPAPEPVQLKPELKKGVSNVTASKPKNIKSR